MASTVRRVGKEAAKFSAVNVVATVVAIVLFNLLAHGIPGLQQPGPLNGWPLTAWFLANCVGMAISFYGSRRYAFKHRRPSGPYGGALNYTVINLASFTIPMACGSPVTPETKAPPSPSMVKAPATSSGSPVAT